MLKKINKTIVDFLDRSFYKKFQNNWDDKMLREYVLKYINKESVLLDIGAGRGILPEMNFKEQVKKAVGVDPVPEVKSNPYLHESHVGLADEMPFLENETFDVVVSDNVLEHVDNPDAFFSEVSRVLKKEGIFIAKTPNVYHYMPTIARITPTSFHKFINKIRGRDSEDTFPTRYKANTRQAQTSYGNKYGMEVVEMKFIEGRPEYMRTIFITYPFGILYEKIVNGFNLNRFKVVIFTVMKKNGFIHDDVGLNEMTKWINKIYEINIEKLPPVNINDKSNEIRLSLYEEIKTAYFK